LPQESDTIAQFYQKGINHDKDPVRDMTKTLFVTWQSPCSWHLVTMSM